MTKAIEMCRSRDAKACSLLANLCVLSEFNADKPACKAFYSFESNINSDTDSTNAPGWKLGLPFLRYSDKVKSEDITRNFKNINLVTVMDPTVNTATTASLLPFYLAVYELDGRYSGFKKLSDELLLCTIKDSEVAYSKMFGVAFNISCDFNESGFLQSIEKTFTYELYLKDGDVYIPIPIATSYLNPSVSVDDITAGRNLKLTHRFFIVDRSTGTEPLSSDGFLNFYPASSNGVMGNFALKECETLGTRKPTFVRYLKKITFYLDSWSDPIDRITRPFFFFEYDSVSTTSSSGTVKLSYQSVFNNELHGLDVACIVLLIIACIIALIISLVRIWIWVKLYPAVTIIPDRTSRLFWAVLYILLETFGLILYIYLIIITMYVYTFFKWQKGVTILLPNEYFYPYRYTQFYILFGFVCGFVLISNLMGLLRQSVCDIFFLDWVDIYNQGKETILFKEGSWNHTSSIHLEDPTCRK